MFLRIRSLVVKELLALVRDPRGRFILIVPPMVQMLVFTCVTVVLASCCLRTPVR